MVLCDAKQMQVMSGQLANALTLTTHLQIAMLLQLWRNSAHNWKAPQRSHQTCFYTPSTEGSPAREMYKDLAEVENFSYTKLVEEENTNVLNYSKKLRNNLETTFLQFNPLLSISS